jgi:hypothetical protein
LRHWSRQIIEFCDFHLQWHERGVDRLHYLLRAGRLALLRKLHGFLRVKICQIYRFLRIFGGGVDEDNIAVIFGRDLDLARQGLGRGRRIGFLRDALKEFGGVQQARIRLRRDLAFAKELDDSR